MLKGVLTYKNGTDYISAVSFMLAWPYGLPRVMSSYAFTNFDKGPPSSGPPFFNVMPILPLFGLREVGEGVGKSHLTPPSRSEPFVATRPLTPIGTHLTNDVLGREALPAPIFAPLLAFLALG